MNEGGEREGGGGIKHARTLTPLHPRSNEQAYNLTNAQITRACLSTCTYTYTHTLGFDFAGVDKIIIERKWKFIPQK